MTKELENNEKILCVPLLFHENLFVTGFRGEAEFFFFFLLQNYVLWYSDSSLPSETIRKMVNSVCSVRFSREDILKIINILNPNWAHDHG